MDTIFFFLRFLDVSCCFENSLFLGIAKVHFEIIQMYSIVVNRGDDRNARSDFCRTSGYRVRQIRIYTVTVFDSSWNEVAGKKRILACHRESTSPFRQSISFSSRNGDTGLFTISRGIRNHFNRVSPQLGVEDSLKKVI